VGVLPCRGSIRRGKGEKSGGKGSAKPIGRVKKGKGDACLASGNKEGERDPNDSGLPADKKKKKKKKKGPPTLRGERIKWKREGCIQKGPTWGALQNSPRGGERGRKKTFYGTPTDSRKDPNWGEIYGGFIQGGKSREREKKPHKRGGRGAFKVGGSLRTDPFPHLEKGRGDHARGRGEPLFSKKAVTQGVTMSQKKQVLLPGGK